MVGSREAGELGLVAPRWRDGGGAGWVLEISGPWQHYLAREGRLRDRVQAVPVDVVFDVGLEGQGPGVLVEGAFRLQVDRPHARLVSRRVRPYLLMPM